MSSVDTHAAYFYCFAVPERLSRPRPILMAGAVGVIEALSLVAYGLSIVVYESVGETTGITGSGADLAPAVLIGIFAVFAALVLLVTWLLYSGRRAARTPFILAQAFAVVVAQPLVSAASTRVLGALVLALAVLGIAAALAPKTGEYLS